MSREEFIFISTRNIGVQTNAKCKKKKKKISQKQGSRGHRNGQTLHEEYAIVIVWKALKLDNHVPIPMEPKSSKGMHRHEAGSFVPITQCLTPAVYSEAWERGADSNRQGQT